MPTIGINMMIFSVDWYVDVGYVAEQIGPFTWRLENVKNCRDTNNGCVWEDIAADRNGARTNATWGPRIDELYLGCNVIRCIPWEGELP
jgi:hypothetical protein